MGDSVNHACDRCGTCCKKGGPALHLSDRPIVDQGLIPSISLFTIRRGELVKDNVKGGLHSTGEEIIKIKGAGGTWTCCYYDELKSGCRIYAHRPVECRLLNCREPQQIERVYANDRLCRKDLLEGVDGLWDLIETHEQRCSYEKLQLMAAEGVCDNRLKKEDAILEIIRYDVHLRRLTAAKGGMDERMLDFIFGRPLTDTIRMFDLALKKEDGRFRLYGNPSFGRP